MPGIGVSPSGKAQGFDPCIPRFESSHPSHCARYAVMELRLADKILFSGNANQQLASNVAEMLNCHLGKSNIGLFSDGESSVEILENVRGKDVFIIQPTSAPPNRNLMEILLMADAIRRASAFRITAVMPYFGYARQDRRVRSARVPISAKVVADMLMKVGLNRILTVDLHADQIQGFFSIPVDNAYGSQALLEDITHKKAKNLVIVSPDIGGVVRARAFAKRLHADLAIIDKRRPHPNETMVMNIIGDVEGRNCLLVDDLVDTAGTLCTAATALAKQGSTSVSAYSTHAILSGNAIKNIESSNLKELVVTDTVPLSAAALHCKKIRQITIAPMLAEAIRRINLEESISCMFDEFF